jgi:predicted Ser/Thr protein kinase
MGTHRQKLISHLYHAALARPPEERGAFLKSACKGDHTLEQELESLLRYDATGAKFLERPAGAMAGKERLPAQDTLGRLNATAETRSATNDFALPMLAAPPESTNDLAFTPGEIIARRYRIVTLLARGGMGEVYRADDLRLGHPVALKFVSPAVARNDLRLQRFIREVRLARQISHPNVCRVYDIGAVAGRYFLSMEYIDGEDLSSLLRRVGRLPADKALDVIHQVCAALAAAHDKGVLHLDLKPANIMIDGRGRALITDFGIAVSRADEIVPGAGTPAYMAPEQVIGRELTIQTDLYALGLVMYEAFTGRRAITGRSADEHPASKTTLEPVPPSEFLPDLPATIERVILKCLQPDRNARPASALAVAAALPGHDILRLARAGIPTPNMVAATGATGALQPAVAWVLFSLVAAGVVGIASQAYRFNVAPWQVRKPPEVLAERAREILAQRKLGAAAVDRAFWWSMAESNSSLHFTYRESATLLIPVNIFRVVTADDPPSDTADLRTVTLTENGDVAEVPVVSRTAWSPARTRISESFLWIAVTIGFVAGAILAHRNVRAGQGDRKGASRVAVFIFSGGVLSAVFRAHHVPSFVDEIGWLLSITGWAVVWSAFAWFAYISFEPYARRWWPMTVISWTPLLAGRWRDPLVGRDVLIGMFAGLMAAAFHLVVLVISSRDAPPSFRAAVLEALGSSAVFGNVLMVEVLNGVQLSLAAMAGLVLLRLLLRRTWIALAGGMAFAIPLFAPSASAPDVVVTAILASAGMLVLLRVGLVANVAMTTVSGLVTSLPLTLDADAWYFGRSLFVILLIGALALYGFVISLGGRPVFGEMRKRS